LVVNYYSNRLLQVVPIITKGTFLLTLIIALKIILVSVLFGALFMFLSWLRIARTGRTGVLGVVLLWAYFLIQVVLAALFFTCLFFLMRFILG